MVQCKDFDKLKDTFKPKCTFYYFDGKVLSLKALQYVLIINLRSAHVYVYLVNL